MTVKRSHFALIWYQCKLYKSIEKLPKRSFGVQLFGLLCLIGFVTFYLFLMGDLIHPICFKLGLPTNRSDLASLPYKCTNSNFPLQVTNNRSLTKRLPNCIIVGARKCGTRALLEFLDIHPQIRKVTDELHFFDDERKYNLGLDWYLEQMPLSLESDVVIEKTPAYFVTEYVPERIYAMNGSIKIILIVRDPVTRLISDYAQLASNRKAKKARNIESFEELIMLANGKVNSNHKAIRISLYAIYFSRWIKLFSKNQIHVVDGDQFVYDPLSELQKIEDFLGLPSLINRDNFTYNTTKGFYCIRTEDNGQRCLNKNKGRKHPDIHPLVIQKLRRFYDPYNKYFYKLVGRKFAWPG